MKPALLCLALTGCVTVYSGCAASTRSKAIQTAFDATVAAGSALAAFDGPYEMKLVAGATTRAAADASLAVWQAERAKAAQALLIATQAEVAASLANDDASLATMAAAVTSLLAELRADGVSLP